MRDLNALNGWRVWDDDVRQAYGWAGDGTCGVFRVPYAARIYLCIASSGDGWDHVSISLPDRCPAWDAMDHLKRRFFRNDEVAMQLHVTPAEHVNLHPFALHLWRPQDAIIPLPPAIMV